MNIEYSAILVSFVLVTFVLQRFFRVRLYDDLGKAVLTTGTFFVVGSVFDTVAIWRGFWTFPSEGTLGIVVGLMPLEEYLFMLAIPYFIIVIYKILNTNNAKEKRDV